MVETYNISIEGIEEEVPVLSVDISDAVIMTLLTSFNGLVNSRILNVIELQLRAPGSS